MPFFNNKIYDEFVGSALLAIAYMHLGAMGLIQSLVICALYLLFGFVQIDANPILSILRRMYGDTQNNIAAVVLAQLAGAAVIGIIKVIWSVNFTSILPSYYFKTALIECVGIALLIYLFLKSKAMLKPIAIALLMGLIHYFISGLGAGILNPAIALSYGIWGWYSWYILIVYIAIVVAFLILFRLFIKKESSALV
jgi:hypothetical protein